MKKLTLLLFLASSITFAQGTVSKKLGDFNTLKVYNGLTVELQKSNESKIEISGSKSDDVVVKNSDGILKIRLQFPEGFTSEDLRIVLFYNQDIDVLDANEGSTILSDETISQLHLEVKTQEGAKITIGVNTKHLTVKAVSGGIIVLSGVTENQNIEATTGGIYESFNLKCKQTIVTAASGARAEVNASEILDAIVRFGGTIYYRGNPEVLKTKKIIGGVIKDRN
tara:strand:- start:1020 stop:1694 length:675 start_codon:yes stop_codon:yes gene_type:complete